MDRPSRKTKTVNYCEAKDFDDDEDFACVKPPPTKKPREGSKLEHKKPSSQESNSQPSQSQKSRQPLDEKLLERDLEAAITLSMLNNTDDTEEQSVTPADVKVQLAADENTDPSSLRISNCSVDVEVMGLDRITPEVQKKRHTKDEDDDYKPKLTPDSESDEDFSEPDESEDEEFTVKKASKAKKKEKVTKKDKPKTAPAPKKEKQPAKPSKTKPQTAAVSTARSPPTAKPAPRKPASSSSVSTSKPLLSPTSAGARIPKWNPPAQIGKSPTSASSQLPAARSPGQGLRLGLSRLVRVKPLHPGVASH